MTTYLEKEENGKTHHYRVTIKQHGIDVVEGVMYNWLVKSFIGCGNNENAKVKEKQLIQEKIQEGFEVKPFQEKPENTENVYDKAKWHYEGNFPEELDEFQGFVHTGLYLGWLIENDLISEDFKENGEEFIAQFKNKKLTGPQLFEVLCDGVLTIEDMNEEANKFSLAYFDFSNGKYLKDYELTLAKELPSLYHVKDTWDNYGKINQVITSRFEEWKKKNNQQ